MDTQATLLVSTATVTSAFDKLPYELLCEICLYLDDPGPLVMASKIFHSLSKDMHWRVKWFFARYELYLIMWHALAHPKLFTPELFKRLLASGAPVSRNLAQLLLLIRGRTNLKSLVTLGEGVQRQRWAGISDSAYATVMNYAVSLYCDRRGLGFHDSPLGCDGYFFNAWEFKSNKEAQARLPLSLLFTSFKFMPLPIQIKAAIPGRAKAEVQVNHALRRLVSRVQYQTFLVPLALANGWSDRTAKCAEVLKYYKRTHGLSIDEEHGWSLRHAQRILNKEAELRGTDVAVADDLATQGKRAVLPVYKLMLALSGSHLLRFKWSELQVARCLKPRKPSESDKPLMLNEPTEQDELMRTKKQDAIKL